MCEDEFRRFLRKVSLTENGCWFWTGAICRGGYGHFRRKIGGVWKMYKAHRYSYEFHIGEILPEQVARHTCDNPSCVNPHHIIPGTHKQNTQDRITRKGPILIRNPRFHNITMDIAKEVRSFASLVPASQKEVAEFFGISKQQTSRILRNEIWTEENQNSL